MQLTELQGENLRCFSRFSITPDLGVNLLLGENGAGKSSILEAIHILGYGRSFRGRIRDGVIKQGCSPLQITVRWNHVNQSTHQAGFQHNGSNWKGRMDGQEVETLSHFCENFPVISFEPGSHALISGASEYRRRFTDWALFHVEPDFIVQWRRFHRALKQRNALLKRQPKPFELAPWDKEYAEAGEALSAYRRRYLNSIEPAMQELVTHFLPECGSLSLNYQAGWRDSQLSLQDALRLNQERDIQTGFCGVGPHRADWDLSLGKGLQQAHFSRGQAKLLALAALLAQTQLFVAAKEFWPILCFDDLASELDQTHFAKVLELLHTSPAQIWISGTQNLPLYSENFNSLKVFHVEHGTILSH